MNRKERLDYLVEQFSVEYRDLKTPEDQEGKKRLLRSLMNLRADDSFVENEGWHAAASLIIYIYLLLYFLFR